MVDDKLGCQRNHVETARIPSTAGKRHTGRKEADLPRIDPMGSEPFRVRNLDLTLTLQMDNQNMIKRTCRGYLESTKPMLLHMDRRPNSAIRQQLRLLPDRRTPHPRRSINQHLTRLAHSLSDSISNTRELRIQDIDGEKQAPRPVTHFSENLM